MGVTPRLALPFLSRGQAQKEFFHNEALQTLDVVAAGAVEDASRSDPPVSPSLGACYLIAAAPTGAWAGKPHCVAAYASGGVPFIEPVDGMSFCVKADARWATYRAGAWEVGLCGDQA